MKKILTVILMASCVSCAALASGRIRHNTTKEKVDEAVVESKNDGHVWTMYQREATEPVSVTYHLKDDKKRKLVELSIEKGKMYWVVEHTDDKGDITGTQLISLKPNSVTGPWGTVRKDNYTPFYNASVAWDDREIVKIYNKSEERRQTSEAIRNAREQDDQEDEE